MKNKNEEEKCISVKEILKVLEELHKMVSNNVDEIDARIESEKHSASEYYISDMKGFSRGMSMMGNTAINFLRERLLKNK